MTKFLRYFTLAFGLFPVLLIAQSQDRLVLKNGEELVGEVINKKNHVLYKKSKESKKQKFPKALVYSCTKILSIYGPERQTFYYKSIKGSKEILVLQKMAAGKRECYHRLSYVSDGGLGSVGSGGSGDLRRGGPVSTYFLGKESDDHLFKVKHGPRFKKFEKMIYKFFDNCSEFNEKYAAGYFGKEIKGLVEMTKFYNEKCN